MQKIEWKQAPMNDWQFQFCCTWWRVVMEPRVSAVAISESSTDGTLLATPTPRPTVYQNENEACDEHRLIGRAILWSFRNSYAYRR